MAMTAAAPRFGSVRYSNRPAVPRPSFRDDTNLVAIRYEKTSQGQAPIAVSTVNPIRPSRPPSAASVSASASASSSSLSSPPTSPSASHSPIIIRPPPGSVPPPPAEEHPALRRGPVLPRAANEWKRDSGHAPASTSSTPTIDEEDCEADFPPRKPSIKPASPVVRQPQDACAHRSAPEEAKEQGEEPRTPVHSDEHSSNTSAATTPSQRRPTSADASSDAADAASQAPCPSPPCPPPLRPRSAASTAAIAQTRPQPAAPAQTTAHQKKLVKSVSLRSVSSLLSRTEERRQGSQDSLLQGGAGSPGSVSAPIQPLVRGSPAPAPTESWDPGHHHQPPGSAPQNRKPPAVVSSLWKRGPFSPMSKSQASRKIGGSDDGDGDDTAAPFSPLSVSLPTDGLLDDDFLAGLSFSKRGSLMFGGRRALGLDAATMDNQQSRDQPRPGSDNGAKGASRAVSNISPTITATPASETVSPLEIQVTSEHRPSRRATPDAVPQAQAQGSDQSQTQSQPQEQESPEKQQPQQLQLQESTNPMPPPDIRVMGTDIDRESQKVRSLYAVGDAIRWEDGARPSLAERRESPIEEVPAEEGEHDPPPAHLAPAASTPRSADSFSLRPSSDHKRETEVAGGFEDWDDLDGAIVDRYGFIMPPPSRPASSRLGTPTELKSAQFSPRRRNMLQKRDPIGASSSLRRLPSRKVSARSLNTQHSGLSATSLRSSRSVIRQAGNLLPHNRERRWMDEAGDMLTVSPSLQDIAEEARVEKITEGLKRKEVERSEKWRKMAKNIKKGALGGGMEFEFDVKNPKLIERTWKGIPDRWRTAAWWSFLAVSASNEPGAPAEQEIIADFHRLQGKSSPDDVQIDLDVPRTISRHIMFRRRYRGGQRLLFRVLHALSIYFPETGYVQGMASLGATLLCYFDEEKCFVMMVRMWQLRGLDRLYRPGFEGLMTGLHEFETTWLNKGVAHKLSELGIDPTAYGTRWYLTLFNLSIPFAAQLRVWDVFLLLGGNPSDDTESKTQLKKSTSTPPTSSSGLDILHATGAALIQALGEVLLDSDFENAMKALTSFIPIKDEDLLMKVAKAEWKARQGKKKA